MKIILSIFLLLLFQNLYSQRYIKGFSINSFQIYSGVNNIGDLQNFNVYNIHKIDKESSLFSSEKLILPEIFSEDYELFGNFADYFNFFLTASAEHELKTLPFYWSFGINCTKSDRNIYDESKNGAQSYDFVYDDSLNLVGYKDSVQDINKKLDIYWDKFSIENSIIFRSNQDQGKSFFMGISNQLGFAVTRYDYNYTNIISVRQSTDGVQQEIMSVENSYSNLYHGKPNFYLSFNAVIGFDFRLSRKEESFFKNVRLFSEFKPGICFLRVPELKKTYKTYNGFFSLIGFRIKL